MSTIPESEYLTTGDAADDLGVTREAVRQMVHAGRLPCAIRTRGGVAIIRAVDVEAFAAKRREQGFTKARPTRGKGHQTRGER